MTRKTTRRHNKSDTAGNKKCILITQLRGGNKNI